MARKQQTSRTVWSTKWYYWLIIIVIVIIILSSLGSILSGMTSAGSKIAQGVLGFAQGVLTTLSKSPFAYFLALILLGPFILRGACAAYKSYKDHFGEGKTNADVQKELGLTKDDFDKLAKETKDLKQTIKDLKKATNQKFVDRSAKQLQDRVNSNELSVEEAQKQQDAIQREAENDAKEDGVEPPEPREINPPPVEANSSSLP